MKVPINALEENHRVKELYTSFSRCENVDNLINVLAKWPTQHSAQTTTHLRFSQIEDGITKVFAELKKTYN